VTGQGGLRGARGAGGREVGTTGWTRSKQEQILNSYGWANEEPAWFCPRPHRIIFTCRLIMVNKGAIRNKTPRSACLFMRPCLLPLRPLEPKNGTSPQRMTTEREYFHRQKKTKGSAQNSRPGRVTSGTGRFEMAVGDRQNETNGKWRHCLTISRITRFDWSRLSDDPPPTFTTVASLVASVCV
jgi:hypothetical protein